MKIKSTLILGVRMKMSKEKTIEWLNQALARGYCTKRNEHKILDPNLILDMAEEIYKEGIKQRIHIILP